jgi:glutaredoxin-related protein
MADDPMLSSYFWIKHILMHILWKNESFFKYNEVDQIPSLNNTFSYLLMDNIFIVFDNQIFQQKVGIPMLKTPVFFFLMCAEHWNTTWN